MAGKIDKNALYDAIRFLNPKCNLSDNAPMYEALNHLFNFDEYWKIFNNLLEDGLIKKMSRELYENGCRQEELVAVVHYQCIKDYVAAKIEVAKHMARSLAKASSEGK